MSRRHRAEPSAPHVVPNWQGRPPASRRNLFPNAVLESLADDRLVGAEMFGVALSPEDFDYLQGVVRVTMKDDLDLVSHAVGESAKLAGILMFATLSYMDGMPVDRLRELFEAMSKTLDDDFRVVAKDHGFVDDTAAAEHSLSALRAMVLGSRAPASDREALASLPNVAVSEPVGTLTWTSAAMARLISSGRLRYDNPTCYRQLPPVEPTGWHASPTHVLEPVSSFERYRQDGRWTTRMRRSVGRKWEEKEIPLSMPEAGTAEFFDGVAAGWLGVPGH